MTDHTKNVAAVVIPYSDKGERFLIAKRSDNGDWEFPGGKEDLDRDNSILDTAEREILEELNIEIVAKKASKNNSYVSGGYNIVPVSAEHSYQDIDQNIELSDHEEYRWINPEKTGLELGDELKCFGAFEKDEITVSKVLIQDDEGKFLMMQKASHYDWMADKWEQPGGKLEGDEDRFEAAKREIRAETGLEAKDFEDLVRLEIEDSNTLVNCFVLFTDEFTGQLSLSEEHQDFRWVDREEALELDWHRNAAYILPVIEYLDEYREEKIYGTGERIDVVKLVLENDEGKFLAMQKISEDKIHSGHKYSLYGRMSGKWELPGGKFKESSNRLDAARREIKEELGIELGELRDVVREEIEEKNQVNTFIVYCSDWEGEIQLSKEHQDYKWVSEEEYKGMDWHQDAGYGYSPMAFLDDYLKD